MSKREDKDTHRQDISDEFYCREEKVEGEDKFDSVVTRYSPKQLSI